MNKNKRLPLGAGEVMADRALWIVDNISAMTAYWDIHQVCRFANAAYREWFGRSREEMIGITLKELLGPIYKKNRPYIEGALEGRMQIFEREIPRPDGSTRHTLATYLPHFIDGVVQGFIVHVADVTLLKEMASELKIAKDKAEQLATHDFLTGLPNRVLFEDRVASAISHARRWKEIVAVVSIDLDNFKDINDTHGHQTGDKVLVEVGGRVKGAIRDCDCVARFGGDEFLIVCTDLHTPADIDVVVNRILETIRLPIDLGPEFCSMTCSIGVSIYPDHGKTATELMARSDKAMYEAKRCGKNRHSVAADVSGNP